MLAQLENPRLRFVKVRRAGKEAFEDEWQKNGYAYNDQRLLQHINAGGNYGCIGGPGKLRILDIDDVNLGNELTKKLNTFTVETGRGGKHFYFTSDYATNHRLKNAMGEFRANNWYVVGPGSTHENGRHYKPINDLPIMEISPTELLSILDPLIIQTAAGKRDNSKETDTSRSGKEFGEVCKLIKQGLTKEQVFYEMSYSAKWSEEGQHYRELTYNNALQAVKAETTARMQPKSQLLKLDNYMENVRNFQEQQPFFYDRAGIFWFWQDHKYRMVDEVDVMLLLDQQLGFNGQTVNSRQKANYLEAFKRQGRLKIPQDPPRAWIQFGAEVHDINTKTVFQAIPKYFFTNSLPYAPRNIPTPTVDKLLHDWSAEYVTTLKEILAYSTYRGYPIDAVFYLYGAGRNGKGEYARMLRKFIGEDNVGSASLNKLTNPDSRFESIKLFKKLAVQIGETDSILLRSTDLLKRLCGRDLIDFEIKGKDPFSAENYAKLIINSNNLPRSNDESDGFYRKQFVIPFPNNFEEGKDVVSTIPENEFHGLSHQVLQILPEVLQRGRFTKQGAIPERKKAYQLASNPLPIFLKEKCDGSDVEATIQYSTLYIAYVQWLKLHNRRRVSQREFSQVLADEGFEVRKTTIDGENARWVYGLSLRD